MSETVSKFEDILGKMRSGDVKLTSTLNLRNENRQNRSANGTLPRLKKDKNKKSKLLILKEIPLSFNPFELEDEEINEDNKFRPQLTVTTIIGALKKFYSENKEIQEKTVFKDWKIEDPDTVTAEDREMFRRFEVNKLFTDDMITIKSKTLNGKYETSSYRSNIKRNDMGDVIDENGNVIDYNSPDYPQALKFQQFYSSIYMEKYNRWEKENMTRSDEDKKKARLNILGDSPISKDLPTNFVVAVELPIEANFTIKDLDKFTAEDVKKHLVVAKLPKDLKTSLQQIVTTYRDTRDTYLDFYEIDMVVGDEEDPMERGNNTKYNNGEKMISTNEGFDKFMVAFTDCINAFDKSEEVVRKTMARRIIDEALMDRFAEAMVLDQKLDDIEEFITQEIADRHANEITQIYADSATDLLTKLDCGELKASTITDTQKKEIETRSIDDLTRAEELEIVDED